MIQLGNSEFVELHRYQAYFQCDSNDEAIELGRKIKSVLSREGRKSGIWRAATTNVLVCPFWAESPDVARQLIRYLCVLIKVPWCQAEKRIQPEILLKQATLNILTQGKEEG